MTHQPYEWVSVAEAAKRLNVSVSTIRRLIESGELVGEREPLGGSRERYRVRMPKDASGTPQTTDPPPGSPDAPETPQDAPAATTGLLEIIEGDRETIRGQAYTIGEQAARIAELEREAGRLEGRAELLQDERDRARNALAEYAERLRAAERPWWQRWLRPD
jgi:excisionase family DNA binding protein